MPGDTLSERLQSEKLRRLQKQYHHINEMNRVIGRNLSLIVQQFARECEEMVSKMSEDLAEDALENSCDAMIEQAVEDLQMDHDPGTDLERCPHCGSGDVCVEPINPMKGAPEHVRCCTCDATASSTGLWNSRISGPSHRPAGPLR